MTDRNGEPVTVGSWVVAIPDGQDDPRTMNVNSVTGSGQCMDCEIIPPGSPLIVEFYAADGFQGGGGSFGGGGASGSW